MAKYLVTVYYTTWTDVKVEADNEEEAKETAYEEAGKKDYNNELLHNLTTNEDVEIYNITD